LGDELAALKEQHLKMRKYAANLATRSLGVEGIVGDAESEEAHGPGLGLKLVEEALTLAVQHTDMQQECEALQNLFFELTTKQIRGAIEIDDFTAVLSFMEQLTKLEDYLKLPSPVDLEAFVLQKEQLATETVYRADQLEQHRDQTVSDARDRIDAMAALTMQVTTAQMQDLLQDVQPLGEYVEENTRNLRERMNDAHLARKEMEKVLELARASFVDFPEAHGNFEHVTKAIEKYDGAVLLNVEETGTTWAQLCELRDGRVEEGRAWLQKAFSQVTVELFAHLAAVQETFRAHLPEDIETFWHRVADRKRQLLEQAQEICKVDKPDICEMEDIYHELDFFPEEILYSETGWKRLQQDRKDNHTLSILKQRMIKAVGMGEAAIVHLLHGEADSVPAIDQALVRYGNSGPDMEKFLVKLRARREELKIPVLANCKSVLGDDEPEPHRTLKAIQDVGYFPELSAEKELLVHHNEGVIQKSRETMERLLVRKVTDLHMLVGSATKFERYLEGTDLRQTWVTLLKHVAHVSAISGHYHKYTTTTPLERTLSTSEEKHEDLVGLFTREPESVQEPDQHSRLPLHTAVSTKGQMALVKKMVELHPDSLLHPDINGCLPLHLALLHKADADVVELLLHVRGSSSADGGSCSCRILCCKRKAQTSTAKEAHDAAELTLKRILTAQTHNIDEWKPVVDENGVREKVDVFKLKSNRPEPITLPMPLHFALQNEEITTPSKIISMLFDPKEWVKEGRGNWEEFALQAGRADIVNEFGDAANIADVRPRMAKKQLVALFSKFVRCCSWRQRRRARESAMELDEYEEAVKAKAKDSALWFEIKLVPIVLLAGLVVSNYFDVITDLMMVFGFFGTGDYGFFAISMGLLVVSMILTCVMDYFQSGCKGLPTKIFLNVTELRLMTETYKALQMWRKGRKPQRGFAQIKAAEGLFESLPQVAVQPQVARSLSRLPPPCISHS
jgi:hypothetical protein